MMASLPIFTPTGRGDYPVTHTWELQSGAIWIVPKTQPIPPAHRGFGLGGRAAQPRPAARSVETVQLLSRYFFGS